MKKHKAIRFVIILIAALIFLFCAAAAVFYLVFNPENGTVSSFAATKSLSETLTADEAVKDLDFMYGTITQKHPAWLEDSSIPQNVKSSYEKERAELLEKENVTVLELWRAASRVFNTVSDGHTTVGVSPAEKMYVDKLFELPDSTLTAVDGISTGELMELFKNMYFYEDAVEFYAEQEFSYKIMRRDYLELLGIDTSDDVALSFEDEENVECGFITEEQVLALKADTEEAPVAAYKIDEEKSLGIFTLNECTVNDEYLSVLDEFFGIVLSQGIKNVAVDLRANGGGDSNVINEFMKYIDTDGYKITGGYEMRFGPLLINSGADMTVNERKSDVFTGELFVLTSCDTFSSAMLFAETVADNKLGTLIGEIPGNMPEGYGDILRFQAPASGLIFTVSYKHFHRINSEKAEEPLMPDYYVASDKAEEQLYALIS